LLDLKWAVECAVRELERDIPQAKYKSLADAYAVAMALATKSIGRPVGASDADVLNGAWLRRRESPDKAEAIGDKALAMMNVKGRVL
jgi:hypothetical protein